MSCKFTILLRESLYQRSTTIQAQRNLIERPLRVVVGTLQCDVCRFQLADLLLLFGSLPIRYGLWQHTRLVNFSSHHCCFFQIETTFILDIV